MSKIDELLKNEKVEWKKLGDLIEYEQPTKYIVDSTDYNDKYQIPVLTAGKSFILGYTDEKTNIYQADKENPVIIFDDFTSSSQWVDFKFKVKSSAMKILKPKNNSNLRYCYHYMNTLNIDTSEHKRLWISKVSKIEIPIPSLKTQEKIVEILDKFTDYVTELQAELQDRTKQYEYYRDMLLSEDYLNKLCKNPQINSYNLRLTTLGEIGVFTRGNGLQKKDFVSKGKPVIHYGQIYTKYNFESNKTFSFVNEEVFSKLKKANCNDILIATTSENIEDVGKAVVWLGDEEIGFSGDMYSYSTTQNSKYVAYYLQTTEFQRQKEKKVTGTKLIRIHGDDMAKFSISLPPIKIQNKVVEVLDKFQSLLADTEGLLPQEIDQRQKQYEYFREKLLTFDGNVVSKQASKQASKIISNRYFDLLEEACDIVGIELFNVEWKSLEEVSTGKLQYGSGASAVEYDGKTRYIRITDIDEMGNLKLEKVSPNKIEDKYYLSYGDILFARSGATVGKNFIYTEDYPAVFAGYLIRLKVNKKLVNPKFVYSCLNTTSYKSFILNKKSNSSKPNINAKQYSEFKIPVPPFAVQEHVVSILDKFDELINDISTGIPKEIELRQKEYEYYRERLLSFPR